MYIRIPYIVKKQTAQQMSVEEQVFKDANGHSELVPQRYASMHPDLYSFPKPQAVVRNRFKVMPNKIKVHRLEKCSFLFKRILKWDYKPKLFFILLWLQLARIAISPALKEQNIVIFCHKIMTKLVTCYLAKGPDT